MGLPRVLLIGRGGAHEDFSSSISTHCFSRMPRGYSSGLRPHSYPLPSCGGALISGIKVVSWGRQGESEGEAAGRDNNVRALGGHNSVTAGLGDVGARIAALGAKPPWSRKG